MLTVYLWISLYRELLRSLTRSRLYAFLNQVVKTLETLPHGIQMIIAGISDIPEGTLVYVHTIWSLQLSRDYAKYHGSGEFTKSPKRPNLEKLDKTIQEYVMSLERHNDHFSIAKFQRRVDKSFENFSKIGAASATEMNIEDIYTGVILVHKYLKNGLEIGRDSNERWNSFCSVLNAVGSQIDKLRKRPNRTRRRVQFLQVRQIHH